MQGGVDSYTNAIFDVYQDNFSEGIFAGKGIYDVSIYNRVLEKEIPENTVLSHDLLEGSFLRCGLLSDVMLLDGYPTKYSAYMLRNHRWIRGDWPYLKKIEIRGISDVEVLSFNEESIQRYIASKVKIGDEIELRKSSAEKANYDIYHMHNGIGTRIGNVSKELLEDIDATISPYKSPWPIVISELYASGIHTEISMNNDVWCWADFCGLGTCEYDVY